MSKVLAFAAIAEAATGVALAVVPSLVTNLLLGAEVTGAGVVAARVAGMALMGLAIACWPSQQSNRLTTSGMLCYSALVAGYLAYLGFRGTWAGPALWPAVAVHAVICGALIHSLMSLPPD